MAAPTVPEWMNADVITNIALTMVPIQKLVTGLAYLMGITFAFRAIYCLRQYGESKTMMSSQASLKEPLVYLLVAGMFIYFPTGLAVLLNTTFGTSNILAYTPIDNGAFGSSLFGGNSPIGEALVLIIQTLGGIAFVRGWILIARSASHGQQGGGVAKGITHIFGGMLAMNIVLTMQIINNTLFGTS